MISCFQLYFNPIYLYVKRSFDLAMDNNGFLLWTLTLFSTIYEIIIEVLNLSYFGMPNLLLLLVIITVFIDAGFGIKKSLKQSKEALVKAMETDPGTPEHKKLMKVHELKKFNISKLQFTFFKCLTLVGYLYFAKNFIQADVDGVLGSVLGFTYGVMLKIPVAIFWYYDFKSIGENSAYIYGKKAPIFTIVENILEFKIKNYLKK